jgi:NitT/TauT family transport system permease protein
MSGYEPAPRADGRARRLRPLPARAAWPPGAVLGCQALILLVLVGGWEAAARAGLVNAFFWSEPSRIAATLVTFVSTGSAFLDVRTTLVETVTGFVLGTGAGSALGLAFWWSRNAAAVLQPYIIVFDSIPKLALAPLVILVFGIGLASKVAIAAALTLVVSTLTVHAGVKALDEDGERLFYSLGASRMQVFRKFVVPSCMPRIVSILRVNIGLALTGAVVGEFIASEHGLGRTIFYAGQTYDIALVWVAVLVLAALAVAMYVGVSAVERLLRRELVH